MERSSGKKHEGWRKTCNGESPAGWIAGRGQGGRARRQGEGGETVGEEYRREEGSGRKERGGMRNKTEHRRRKEGRREGRRKCF